ANPTTLRLVSTTNTARAPRSTRSFLLGSVMRLTPGDRRIALALHSAQSAAPSDADGADGAQARPKTLEEIVGMERPHGWSHVFKTLKAQGLLHEQTLGHVVARWGQRTESETIAMLDSRVALRAPSSRVPSRIDS